MQTNLTGLSFQDIILKLQHYWAALGCAILQPYDKEMGAGTSHPATFLRSIGPEPWSAAYVQGCRRPKDARYGDSPNRLGHYYQFQVVLKPSPMNIQELYIESLRCLGINTEIHDIRFVEDNWENPTLGAWGLGWEVWLDGMEVGQFTYFQQVGGLDCRPVTGEITYGLERLAMYLQNVDNVYNLVWVTSSAGRSTYYGDIFLQNEIEQSKYNFEYSNIDYLLNNFNDLESEAQQLLQNNLIIPSYEMLLSAAHVFNLLDARGVISVTQRASYIGRIRYLAKEIATRYLLSREELNYPLLKDR